MNRWLGNHTLRSIGKSLRLPLSGIIGSAVHYGHFEKEHLIEEALLMFKTQEASKLFLIIC